MYQQSLLSPVGMLADTTDCNKLKSAVFRLFCRDCPASCRNVHVRSRGRDFVLNTFRLRLGKRRPWPCVRLLLFGRLAWPDHKVECAGLCKVSPNVPDTSVRYFCRLLVKLSNKDAWSKAEMVFGKKRCFTDLMSHVEAIKNDHSRYLKEFKRLWETSKVFLDNKYLPEPEVGLEIYGKMIINSYCICNDEHSPIGTGLYIGPSILDHSCSPNAHAVYEGHKLQLRAAGDIKCSSLDGVPDYVTEKSAALTASVKEKMKEVEEQAMQHTTTLLQLRQWAENLLETEQLVEADYARIHALDLLSKCCLGLEDYQAALPPYLAREPIYRQCYGLYSPVYGVLLYSIAKLYHVTVQLKKAMEYFEKAEAVLAVSHGHSHSLYKHLEEAYLHCKLEVENPGNGEAITVK
ncbi:histone-lysine N-methyltransferase SMYD3-like isoform X5 [Dermacentor andersoni]|uniref:histone-lysine N-methyltransferase SMYD3-like isoform X5 n=1 Tax=Dermacentor andersoni TaxID=34620 RepID=UPI003B3BE3ED